ncbi:hypothetical protein Taro_020059 [Colocasia esculenta]|uniref:GIY-YIG domain-containing protein n=1 Tax=Colocasia esculenta TaxID=4460 RepID=A0A843UXW6_COLES|nr:hypothetical protein [Colocasia esculenta]
MLNLMARRLSNIFPSTKRNARSDPAKAFAAAADSSSEEASVASTSSRGGGRAAAGRTPVRCRGVGGRRSSPWCVYLIVSTRLPKTYVGVTTNFPRRSPEHLDLVNEKFPLSLSRLKVPQKQFICSLKQHNGELKGGAKASSAGRPWICACIVRGFEEKSAAFQFEAKWKSISRKLPRKNKKDDSFLNKLLLHRKAALSRVTNSLDCHHLHVDWMIGDS